MCLVDPYDEYKLNIYSGSSLDEGFERHRKEVWKVDKFDYCIGNPPFNQMIDMTFVQDFYKISNVVLFVHPSTWLLDEKGKQKKFTKTKDLIREHLESIELFNGNKIFGISLFVPCVITYINKFKKSSGIHCIDKINNVELIYDDIYQINKYSDVDIYIKIKNKITNILSTHSILIDQKNKINGDFYVNTAQIRGNVSKNDDSKMFQDDFYTIITKETRVLNRKDKHMFFTFKSEIEGNNFIEYLKTNFVRFCLSILKNNSQLDRGELSMIPWLDFSKRWTDEELIKEFELEDEEVIFIAKSIIEYYD